METCSVSLDLGASSQLAATIIGSSQRLFSLAEVYDVSDDAWLGKGNNMRLITRTFDRSHALALNSDGGMKLFHKASKALSRAKSHGCKVGFGATTELTERFCQISAEFKLASILNKSRATFWNAQQSGQEIGIWYFKEIGRSAELVVKVEKSLSDLTFAHNKCDREGKNVVYGWSKHLMLTEMVFMLPESLAQWRLDIQCAAERAGLSSEEYAYAVGSINDEMLRLWAIMGPKAKVTPFDLVACQGMITLGKTKIVFSQNGLDMMDVRAEQVDKVVAVRKDLTSVRMPIENTGGTFNAPVTYSELGSAGYEVWIESKMC